LIIVSFIGAPSIDSPDPEIQPQVRVRLIERDDLNQRPARITALKVQRASSVCEAQDQATRAILVVGIVFNHLASVSNRLLDLGYRNTSEDALINGMPGEFILPSQHLASDLTKNIHAAIHLTRQPNQLYHFGGFSDNTPAGPAEADPATGKLFAFSRPMVGALPFRIVELARSFVFPPTAA
jgi:hypothetical protein